MKRDEWQRRYLAADRVWSGQANPWLVEAVGDLPPSTALDLAAGEGADAIWLARHGWRVTAVDFAAAALERGEIAAEDAGVADRITWLCEDLATWRPADRFDLVSVQYLHGPPSVRAAVHAVAWRATAGTLVIVGHDPHNLIEGHGGPPDPAVLYAPRDVLNTLGLSATSPEVIVAERRARHADEPDLIAWDCVVVVSRASRTVQTGQETTIRR